MRVVTCPKKVYSIPRRPPKENPAPFIALTPIKPQQEATTR